MLALPADLANSSDRTESIRLWTVTTKAIAQGFDKKVPLTHQRFLYFPLMHCESLLGQIAAKGLYEGLALRCSDGDPKSKKFADGRVEFAQQHRYECHCKI